MEQVASMLLVRYLGEYVEGLESNHLRISVMSGDVNLKNLRLKSNILDNLNLPVTVHAGFLGELTVRIPWSNLQSKPTVVEINDVHLIAVPRAVEDATKEKRLQLAQLMGLDSPPIEDEETKVAKKKKPKSEAGFLEKLATRVVNNLQVIVRNVHVRYEDDQSNPSVCYTKQGITETCKVTSTNSEWEPTLEHTVENIIYKLIVVEHGSLYWDIGARMLHKGPDKDLVPAMRQMITTDAHSATHTYVLPPTSADARLRVNKSIIPEPGQAKVEVQCQCERLDFTLHDPQFRDMMNMKHLFSNFHKTCKYQRYRPPTNQSPTTHPLEWWRYAYSVVTHDHAQKMARLQWAYIKNFVDSRKAYVKFYAKKPNDRSTLEKQQLEAMERIYGYEDILLYV